MGTFLASRKVCGRLEPSKSSPTRPIPASICLLMSALECSQAILCVIQSPPTARPLAPRSGPSAERIGGPRRCVSRRRGGLERVFLARSARPGPRGCGRSVRSAPDGSESTLNGSGRVGWWSRVVERLTGLLVARVNVPQWSLLPSKRIFDVFRDCARSRGRWGDRVMFQSIPTVILDYARDVECVKPLVQTFPPFSK